MIRNTHCPYCGEEMIIAENDGTSRSVEHLIPNAVLSKPRSKGEGDFYACRDCNSAKSNLDNVLGTLARAQAPNPHLAASALVEAIRSDKGSSKRFIEMVRSAEHKSDGVHMTMPFDGREMFDYISYLSKGCHFMATGTILDGSHVVLQEFVGKAVIDSFHDAYLAQHGSNPVLDLAANPLSRSWGNGEVVLWTRGPDHLLFLHWYVGIIMQVRPRSRQNFRRSRELEDRMLRDFAKWRQQGAAVRRNARRDPTPSC